MPVWVVTIRCALSTIPTIQLRVRYIGSSGEIVGLPDFS